MRTPAQIAGHPIHPMLVTIPIGLWLFSLVCDLVALRSGNPQIWSTCARYAMVGGILGALAAALPGLVDLLSLQDASIKRTALTHMGLNLTVVALYVINAWTRFSGAVSPGVSLGLSVVGIAILAVSGWLGGKMVYEDGVAVHAGESAEDRERAGAWRADRGAAWTRPAASGLRGERAMASDASRPGTAMGAGAPEGATDRPWAGDRTRE